MDLSSLQPWSRTKLWITTGISLTIALRWVNRAKSKSACLPTHYQPDEPNACETYLDHTSILYVMAHMDRTNASAEWQSYKKGHQSGIRYSSSNFCPSPLWRLVPCIHNLKTFTKFQTSKLNCYTTTVIKAINRSPSLVEHETPAAITTVEHLQP